MTVRERTAAVRKAKAAIQDHCMCARFTESDTHYLVLYPPGFRVDGARIDKAMGKLNALETLLPILERHWGEG